MNRREFLKAVSVAGAAAVITPAATINNVLAAENSSGAANLVAIMGGQPAAMLDRMFQEMGGIGRFVKKGQKVVVKPNIGWNKPPEMAANTNPDLVGALVDRCLKAGASEVLVFDHTCATWTECYKNSGIKAAVEAAGGKMVAGNDESMYVDVDLPKGVKLKKAKVHKALMECDVWFNVPVVKHHGGAKMTVSMKNLMGIVWDRRVFHVTDLQQCIADIATFERKPALHIVDCYRALLQNGPQGKTESDVALLKGLFASTDPVAVDTAAVKFFSQAKAVDIKTVSHIQKAESLGVGTMDIESLNVKRIRL